MFNGSKHIDDDDPIVKVIPVYLAKRMSKQLFVFQYPLIPRGNASMVVQKTCMRPINKEVKMDVTINMHSSNFDTIRAEDLARLIRNSDKDKKDKKKERSFSTGTFSKVSLVSSKVLSDTSHYGIGLFNGHELHITPLEGYIQMRPSLGFVDACMSQKKGQQDNEDAESEPGSSAQAVTVKFARNELDKIRPSELTYKQHRDRINMEKWLYCRWQTNINKEYDYLNHKLYCENKQDIAKLSLVTKAEYIKMIVPEDQKQAVIKPSLPSHVVSLHAVRTLSVQEQCRLLLKGTKMIQFQQLMLLLASGKGITREAVIKSLPQVAVLVKGNWVAKSEILYPQNSFSAISGVSAEQMCKARDYVLYQFTKHDYVERRKVSQTIRLPTEEVKEIFTGLSRLRHNKGWELLLPEDLEFLSKHADIVERQKRLWEHRWQQLQDHYKDCPKPSRKKSRSICGDPDGKANEARTETVIKREPRSDSEAEGDKFDSPPKCKTPKRKNNTFNSLHIVKQEPFTDGDD